MQITIRNQRLLRILGFQPNSQPSNMVVGLSIRGWLETIRWRLRAQIMERQMLDWSAFADVELAAELTKRGYIVRHKTEAQRQLSWNRTAPFPDGVDFKTEAVEKLREQIAPDLIDFEVMSAQEFRPEIHRAVLRVLR